MTYRKMASGKIFLIPVTLGDDDYSKVIPEKVLAVTRSLRLFAVEDLRSARRYLRLIDNNFPINESVFLELNEHTRESVIGQFLEPVLKGSDMGIISEAGLPCIADPGSKLILIAHQNNIKIIPLTGPSAILLAIISSGLNGQNFTFNGYLPVKPSDRELRIRELEKGCRSGYAQVFMETPYRNQKMLDSILAVCNDDTNLCIALDITLPEEDIRTMTISEWKRTKPSINDRLAVFILQ
jgi:16S rRNA (cytidine1402-2'-O)-methyltransferase